MVLRKLIAISVVFALVAGTAFAEISLGGTVFGKVDVVKGDNGKDANDDANPMRVDGGIGRIDVSANAESDDGSFGGFLRFRSEGWGDGTNGWGLAWWKPIDQVKFQIGNNPDGIFDTSHMTRWGFYQVAGDVGVVKPGNAWYNGGYYDHPAAFSGSGDGLGIVTSDYVFFGGFGGFGAMLSITPVDMFALNFVIPYADDWAENVYKKLIAQAVVNLDGIGQFNLTYEAGKGYKEGKEGAAAPGYNESPGKIYASFYLSMIENLGVDLGFSFTLPKKTADGKETDKNSVPLGLGLGVQYGAGQFGIKARVLTALGGKYANGDEAIPLGLTFDLLPSFAVTDDLTVFFSAGLGLAGLPEEASEGQALVNFHINPYVQYKFDWSKGLFAGFRLESNGSYDKDEDAGINWSVPVGVYFTF